MAKIKTGSTFLDGKIIASQDDIAAKTGNLIALQTTDKSTLVNAINEVNNGLGSAEAGVGDLYKHVANLELQLEASKRVPNGVTFGYTPLTSFGLTLDTTKTTVVGALSAGATTVTVESVTGLQVGHEVTIYDDVNIERVTISAIAGNDLTVSALVNAYKDGANLARSMAVEDTVNGLLKFGGWGSYTDYTVTDATVTPNAYDTSGNGGRKTAYLLNGWVVATSFDSIGKLHYFHVDKQDGNGFVQLCTVGDSITAKYISISAVGNKIYAIVGFNNSGTYGVKSVVIDSETQTNTTIAPADLVDNSQTGLSGISLTINEAGTELHAAWASKNSTYPASFNIRYAKGTINGDGSVTWGAVEQVTEVNNAGRNYEMPTITHDGSYPHISLAYSDTNTGNHYIVHLTKSNTTKNFASGDIHVDWGSISIYSGIGYTQSSPSAIFVPQSVNGLANGRIWVAWHGKDATDTTYYNIKVSYSDDGGVTWSSPTKLTNGNNYTNAYPSITANALNEVWVVWQGNDSVDNVMDIRNAKNINGTWASVDLVKTNATADANTPSTLFDPTFTLDFSEPLFIYQDNENTKVGFYGTWTVGSTVPLLENDVRFTIDKQTDEVAAYIIRDLNLTVDAEMNGEVPTKTTVGNEDQFTHTLGSVTDVELKLTMTRGQTTDDVAISKILGGVA